MRSRMSVKLTREPLVQSTGKKADLDQAERRAGAPKPVRAKGSDGGAN